MEGAIEKVKKLRPIDDVFFEKLIEDREVCEENLRVILEDEKLEVLSVTPQSSQKNLWGRSVRLDAFCRLGNGTLVNIEVQTGKQDDYIRRVRYNASCITSNNTKVGAKFLDVPDVTMVSISSFDIFQRGKTIYHCRTVIEETKDVVENGLTEIYVNTAIHDGSTIADLMECFTKEQFQHEKFPLLSKRVWYYKNEERGVQTMCQIVEEYAEEKVLLTTVENIRNLFMNGCSLEVVVASFQNLTEEQIRIIYLDVKRTENK